MKEMLNSVKFKNHFLLLNSSFRHYLSRNETLPLANLLFVNRSITDNYSRNHLSVNSLRKTSKIALFSAEEQFLHEDAILEGSKFE